MYVKGQNKVQKDKMYVSKVAIEFMPSKIQGEMAERLLLKLPRKQYSNQSTCNTCNYIVPSINVSV